MFSKSLFKKMADNRKKPPTRKLDPEISKKVLAQALSLITPEQRRSQAMPFHRDAKLRELVMEMIQE